MANKLKKGDVITARIYCSATEFPLDMLRYDFCTFAEQNPTLQKRNAYREPFTVKVKKVVTDPKAPQWTTARWSSFRCDVVPGLN